MVGSSGNAGRWPATRRWWVHEEPASGRHYRRRGLRALDVLDLLF